MLFAAGCAAGGAVDGAGGMEGDDAVLDDERGDALRYETWPVIRLGDSDPNVVALQHLLAQHGEPVEVTGLFDDETDQAVRAFQSQRGLTTDGIVGKNTWGKLVVQVRQGSSGDAVRAVQDVLLQRYEYVVEVNGQFDAATVEQVKKFQGDMCLRWVDAIVGAETWYTLLSGANQCSGGGKPGGGTVGGDAMTVAGRIMGAHEGGKIVLLNFQISKMRMDGATAHDNILDISQGLQARRSSYGNAPGGTTAIAMDVLEALDDYANNQGGRYQVNALAGASHSKNSAHYRGQAVDFQVQGNASKLMKMCRNAGANLVLGPGDAGHSTHVHCQW